MKLILIVLFFIAIWFLSAISHEADLSRNFNKTGDAEAFFFPIKIEKYNQSLDHDTKSNGD